MNKIALTAAMALSIFGCTANGTGRDSDYTPLVNIGMTDAQVKQEIAKSYWFIATADMNESTGEVRTLYRNSHDSPSMYMTIAEKENAAGQFVVSNVMYGILP